MYPLDALMPNDLCARCDEEEAVFSHVFKTSFGPEESQIKLGFCSVRCEAAFVQGITAAKELQTL